MKNSITLFLAVLMFVVSGLAQTQDGPLPEDQIVRIERREVTDVSDKDKWETRASYPELRLKGGTVDEVFSSAAKKLAFDEVNRFKNDMAELAKQVSGKPRGGNFYHEVNYETTHFDGEIASFLYIFSEYAGGAHPNSWSKTLTYDIKSKKFIGLEDLFNKDSEWLPAISKLAVDDLIKQQDERGRADKEWILRGAGPDAKNFSSWSLSAEGINLMFDAYRVGPYVAGSFSVLIPYDRIPKNVRSAQFYKAESLSYIGGNPRNWCRNGHFPASEDAFYLSKVIGSKKSRSYFYNDDNDGPGTSGSKQKAYLIPGDEVIVKREYREFSCVWYQPKKGSETVGWVKTETLRRIPDVSRPPFNWSGKWFFGQNDIQITKNKTNLSVKGVAIWQGIGDNVHVGELDYFGLPIRRTMLVGDADNEGCQAKLTRLGKYLIVSDNRQCGGLNVAFDGVYLRKSGRR